MAMGWTAWIGYITTAPIEVEAMLKYLAPHSPWLHTVETGKLTGAGVFIAWVFILLFVAVNALGSGSSRVLMRPLPGRRTLSL